MTNLVAQHSAPTTASPTLTLPAVALSGGPILWISAWLIMRIDGHSRPGWGWTTAHLLWVGAYVLFGIASLTLYRANTHDRAAWLSAPAIALAVTGAIAFVGQMVVDLAMGILANDKAELSQLYDTATDVALVELILYQVGPPLLFAGLLALVIKAAVRRDIQPWMAVTTGAGVAAIVAGRIGPDALRFVEGLGGLMLLFALTAVAGVLPRKP